MTETREFNAATVEEAVEKASETIGVDPNELSYEIVDAGSSGFMGMGARDARIVVDHEDASEASALGDELQQKESEESNGSHATDELLRSTDRPEAEVTEDLIRDIEMVAKPVIEAMGFDARIDVYDAGGCVAVDVSTSETGLFIGQKGETIDALQYLLNVSVYKNHQFAKRLVVDSEGYRQRRIEAIQGMAHRTARRAVRARQAIELPPMNPSERRVVHLFLRDNPHVTTASEGTEGNRRVTISPSG